MSNPFKKIKRAVKKGTKKLKKGLGSLANTVADKLVPKELAPFLPMLAPLFMGPGAGLLSRYLMPQILTALASGKQTGDINLTSQALTGIASALSDPGRLKLDANKALATDTPPGMGQTTVPDQVGFGQLDPATGEYIFPEGGDLMLRSDGSVMTVDQLPKSTMVDGTPMNVIDAGTSNLVAVPGGGTQSVNIPVSRAQGITGTLPQTTAPSIFEAGPGRPTFAEFKDLSFGDKLRTGINETLDFMQGQNIANKGPFGDPILDDAGNPLLVQDAGFFANLPRRAITQGILTAGPLLQSFEAAEEEAAALAAEQEDQQQAMNDARQSLTDYYLGLSDPTQRFGALSFLNSGGRVGMEMGGIMNAAPGMPQGMQVDGRNGTFIPMGVEEKADDVPAMLSKNEFVMTADAVRAAGGGSVEKGAQRMYDLMNSLEARV